MEKTNPSEFSKKKNKLNYRELLMENMLDELDMVTSPLAESEDSIISELSTKYDVTRSSWLETKQPRRYELETINDGEMIYGPPPLPDKDYSRLRPFVYRKKGEEYNMKRSKSYERPKPPRPRTPDRQYSRNSRNIIDKRQIEAIYATPNKTRTKKEEMTNIINEFDDVPKYVKREEIIEAVKTPSTFLDMSSEIEFNSKITNVEQKLKTLKMAREDSLTSLLKKELSKRNNKQNDELPEYVEPKDPIIRELQEFLNIEPGNKNGCKETGNDGENGEEDEDNSGENTVRQDNKSTKKNDEENDKNGQLNGTFSFSTASSSTSSTAV